MVKQLMKKHLTGHSIAVKPSVGHHAKHEDAKAAYLRHASEGDDNYSGSKRSLSTGAAL